LFGIFLVWVHFHPFYFLFLGEGAFDVGYVFNDLGEYTFEDLNDWDKSGSYFGLSGIQRIVVQLFGQLMELNCIGNNMRRGRKNKGD
jgi:hypothetical protein